MRFWTHLSEKPTQNFNEISSILKNQTFPKTPNPRFQNMKCMNEKGLEDEEAPKRRGFQAGVDLRLSAINTINVNRKRGRERKDNQKNPKQYQIYQVYWKESTYAWKMHEHVTSKTNCIMGWAQSKPISTQTDSTHLNAWQYYFNANVIQCMRF